MSPTSPAVTPDLAIPLTKEEIADMLFSEMRRRGLMPDGAYQSATFFNEFNLLSCRFTMELHLWKDQVPS